MFSLGPTVLEGRHVRLEPLRAHHAEALLAAARDPEIWHWMPTPLTTREAIDRYIDEGMRAEVDGHAYRFVVVTRDSERVVGSTAYLDVQAPHRGVEIGWTWYTPDVWGTVVNPEAKLLLLQHAFEDWEAIRVALKTDHMNVRSQEAIRKLGAQYEGTLRNHRVRPDGTIRHSVMFSIVDSEWPQVRVTLARRIAQF